MFAQTLGTVATDKFGVTINYLTHADELQRKPRHTHVQKSKRTRVDSIWTLSFDQLQLGSTKAIALPSIRPHPRLSQITRIASALTWNML